MKVSTFFYILAALWAVIAILTAGSSGRAIEGLICLILAQVNVGFAVTLEVIERASKREH